MSNRTRKDSFTLVEILVALAIIVTILFILHGSFAATSRSAEACDNTIVPFQYLRQTVERMARQIRCAYAPHSVNTAKDTLPFSDTDAKSFDPAQSVSLQRTEPKRRINYLNSNPDIPGGEVLHLVTTNTILSGKVPQNGLFDVVYKFDKTRGVLFVSEQRFIGAATNVGSVKNWQPILTNIVSFELAFFDGQLWLSKWDFNDSKSLPRIVRITVISQDDNHRQCHYTTTAYVNCLASSNITK